MLTVSLPFFAGCPTASPEPVTCVDIRPPCSLPAVPVRPALPTARGNGDEIALSLIDARKLWAHLERTGAWMRQAALCAQSFAVEAKEQSDGGK